MAAPLYRIRWGRTLGVIPHAHVCEGSVVVKTFHGLTGGHAEGRAWRWIVARDNNSCDYGAGLRAMLLLIGHANCPNCGRTMPHN